MESAQRHMSRRDPAFGLIPSVEETFEPDESLEMFRRMCRIRYFELQVYDACESGYLHCLPYISAGQESIAASVSMVMAGSYVFTQHRGHSAYIAFGGDLVKLTDELLGLPTGCCGGMGGSPCIQDRDIKMIGHEGLIGSHVPIAVGVALGSPNERVVCFFGDGAVEEDYMYGALGFAATHKLPVLFVCEDNDLSVLTPTAVRRNWVIDDLARSIGIEAIDITDDPWLIKHYCEEFSSRLPALINCRTCRVFWHVGAGQDAEPEWDRIACVREKLMLHGLGEEAERIEEATRRELEKLWHERLQMRFAKSPEST